MVMKKMDELFNMFKGYYKKSREERLNILKDSGKLDDTGYIYFMDSNTLSNEIAGKLVENQIGIYSLPLGIATNFVINKKPYLIPMAVEEPSVIAAASNAAKIIKEEGGGITVEMPERLMTGQIAIYDYKKKNGNKLIEENKEMLLKLANMSHAGITKLGGGARDIYLEKKDEFYIVYLVVDVLDAMGANILNTMLEAIAPLVEEILEGKRLMGIISNYSTRAVVKASCKMRVTKDFGERMQLAYEFAKADEYRAVTNNKGIFNGIDAIAIATGNDFRAIEACGHCYATRNGRYEPLTTWKYENRYLYGTLELAMPIATVGGSIGLNETAKYSLEILGTKDAKELAMITVALGLAQNFAALRALVTEGIQQGHMKLQANSVALFAGANEDEVEKVVFEMINRKSIELETAKKILEELRK